MLIKQKSPLLLRNLAFVSFGKLLIVFLTKLICYTYSIHENFSKNSNLNDLGISLPVFPFRNNLKLHNIFVTPKMVKKVIMNLDLSEASGPDCIPVLVLKNLELELSYILAELFNKCL